MGLKAVIFDLGGVVLASPLHTIARYELEKGIPEGFLNRVVRETGPDGAWSRHERGEIDMETFCSDFDLECEQRGHLLPTKAVMEAIAASSGPRPEMIEALERLRSAALKTAALTNNWKSDGQDRYRLRPLFDHYVESSVVGLRKPDPAIYQHVLGALAVTASEAAFLDDIGGNLKPARAMGMTTIKVVDAPQALGELGEALGLDLLG
ncbi:MAG: HAD family phosphatase [Acidobacteriota bacterium]|nr:HAD family phosphatase [Acidobacteriota bacterium]